MPQWKTSDREIVEGCLKKILSSAVFEHSPRQQRLLSYLVSHALAPEAQPLKGYTIGVEVFDRGTGFDPSMEPIVRVEAARLRNKLREYYVGEGWDDPVVIELPKGGYHLHIGLRTYPVPLAAPDSPAQTKPKPPLSFAVLPFSCHGSALGLDALAYGLGENLITELSRLPGLHVLSRKSSAATVETGASATELGERLGVRYLIEGSIQAVGRRASIIVHLVETESGRTVCGERFERDFDDVLKLQNEIVQCAIASIQQKLAPSGLMQGGSMPGTQADFGHRRTADISGWRMAQVALDDARSQFQQAVECDPSYAAGHALLARTLLFQWCLAWGDGRGLLERALQHKRTAIALNRHHAFSRGVAEMTRLGHRHALDAVREARDALTYDPGNADAALLLSLNLSSAQMPEEARHFLDKARSPLLYPSPFHQFALGQCHYAEGELGQADSALKRCAELCNVPLPMGIYRITCLELLGSIEEENQARRDLRAVLVGDEGSMMMRFAPPDRRSFVQRSQNVPDRRKPRPATA
jgi:TolB-like protein/Tfp pilus assembly protein PilF